MQKGPFASGGFIHGGSLESVFDQILKHGVERPQDQPDRFKEAFLNQPDRPGEIWLNHALTLPWPPRDLSPNSRANWRKKAKAAKSYRTTCHIMTKQARIVAPEGRVLLVMTFCPPDRRRRDDDNCIASMKSGRDGIADALGIDDSRFMVHARMGEPRKGGAVLVWIGGEVSA